jgi:3-keto-5-aminohexanoate cleavage enzyme
MHDLILTAAIVGAEVMRSDNPAVPYTAKELAQETKRCVDAGASIVHIHVRQEDGTPSQSHDLFSKALQEIIALCDPVPIVQFSTGGAVGMSVPERIQALSIRPEMCTLNTGSVNFGDAVFINSLPDIREILSKITAFGIKPEIECFDVGFVETALLLLKKEELSAPLHFDFVLGVPGALGARTEALELMRAMIPEDATWCVAGVGRHQLPMAQVAIEKGGFARCGLEDNIYLSKGVLAKGSYELVEKLAEMGANNGRNIATPAKAREILSMPAFDAGRFVF